MTDIVVISFIAIALTVMVAAFVRQNILDRREQQQIRAMPSGEQERMRLEHEAWRQTLQP